MFPSFDPLVEFSRWFLAQPIRAIRPPHYGVTNFGIVVSLVLYRQPPFQVELFIAPPNTPGFPDEHAHPNVDSIEMHLSGDLFLHVDGQRTAADSDIAATAPEGHSAIWGSAVRVRDGAPHGAKIGPEGAAFLSLQYWKNGVQPTSVGFDWAGEPVSDLHSSLLKSNS